jgi:hypothetical protein
MILTTKNYSALAMPKFWECGEPARHQEVLKEGVSMESVDCAILTKRQCDSEPAFETS